MCFAGPPVRDNRRRYGSRRVQKALQNEGIKIAGRPVPSSPSKTRFPAGTDARAELAGHPAVQFCAAAADRLGLLTPAMGYGLARIYCLS